jgi:hypothetical protein
MVKKREKREGEIYRSRFKSINMLCVCCVCVCVCVCVCINISETLQTISISL